MAKPPLRYDDLVSALESQRSVLLVAQPDLDPPRLESTDPAEALRCLVHSVLLGRDHGVDPSPAALRLVVRALTGLLAARAPGRSVEVRVPPHVAVQCVAGPRHTRGTPSATVEAEPLGWLDVLTGRLSWQDAVAAGVVRPSGARADLSALLPVLS